MLDPQAGFGIALALASAVGAVVFVLFLVAALVGGYRGQHHIDASLTAIFAVLSLVVAAIPAAATFCATFSVVNLALQADRLSVQAVQDDLTAGTLTLRIVSLVLLVKIGRIMGHLLTSGETELSVGGQDYEPRAGGLLDRARQVCRAPDSGLPSLSLDEYRDCPTRDVVTATQYGIYLSVLTLLWVITASDGGSSVVALALSFGLLFIVDDWVIISEYYVVLRGRLIRAHRYRVDVANLLIVPAAVWASFESLRLPYALISATVLVLLSGLRYVTYYAPEIRDRRVAAADDPATEPSAPDASAGG